MQNELEELFPPRGEECYPMAVLRRHGHLQLALPSRGSAALYGIELYPAQRRVARCIRSALSLFAKLDLPIPLPRTEIHLDPESPFTRFLKSFAIGNTFDLSIYAGNPKVPGRRWLCLVSSAKKPVCVVKAGVTPEARALIAREVDFLCSAMPSHSLKVIAQHDCNRVRAFAGPFIPEHRKSSLSICEAIHITEEWIRKDAFSPLGTRPALQALVAKTRNEAELRRLHTISSVTAVETISHGDYAPWNIKRDRDSSEWIVVDWERGDYNGVPGWDIIHFLVQPLILVHRASPSSIVKQLCSFLTSPTWMRRAEANGVSNISLQLAWSYALHAGRVNRQSEKSDTLEEVAKILASICRAA